MAITDRERDAEGNAADGIRAAFPSGDPDPLTHRPVVPLIQFVPARHIRAGDTVLVTVDGVRRSHVVTTVDRRDGYATITWATGYKVLDGDETVSRVIALQVKAEDLAAGDVFVYHVYRRDGTGMGVEVAVLNAHRVDDLLNGTPSIQLWCQRDDDGSFGWVHFRGRDTVNVKL